MAAVYKQAQCDDYVEGSSQTQGYWGFAMISVRWLSSINERGERSDVKLRGDWAQPGSEKQWGVNVQCLVAVENKREMSQLREPQQQQQKCRRKQRKSCKDLLGPRRGIELLRFFFFCKDLLAYFGSSVNVHSLVLSFASSLTFPNFVFSHVSSRKVFL